MSDNPIIAASEAALTSLSEAQRREAHRVVREWSALNMGEHLDAAELVALAIGIKCVAAKDGLSLPESARLTELMPATELPPVLFGHVMDFDPAEASEIDIAQVAPKGSRRARFLLLGALSVAAQDGLSEAEEAMADRLGEHLGVRRAMVAAFVAEARLHALHRGDHAEDARNQLRALRRALLSLPPYGAP